MRSSNPHPLTKLPRKHAQFVPPSAPPRLHPPKPKPLPSIKAGPWLSKISSYGAAVGRCLPASSQSVCVCVGGGDWRGWGSQVLALPGGKGQSPHVCLPFGGHEMTCAAKPSSPRPSLAPALDPSARPLPVSVTVAQWFSPFYRGKLEVLRCSACPRGSMHVPRARPLPRQPAPSKWSSGSPPLPRGAAAWCARIAGASPTTSAAATSRFEGTGVSMLHRTCRLSLQRLCVMCGRALRVLFHPFFFLSFFLVFLPPVHLLGVTGEDEGTQPEGWKRSFLSKK